MPLFVTPGHLASRAALYQQLAQLTAAGITLQAAIELQHRSPPARSLRQGLAVVLAQLERGATFAEALQGAERWVPAFDLALLHAGEQSGRLPQSFQSLANHYESGARLLREMISSLLYPALLFHMAAFIGPLPGYFQNWNLIAYLAKVAGLLVPAYAIFFTISWLLHSQQHPHWSSAIESLLHRVPLFGKARRNLALARLASALEALVSAGVPILSAWELAATAAGSPALRRTVMKWKPQVENGVTPAEAVRQSPEFPELFANLYQTGELTGTIDDTLRRLEKLYHEEGNRQMKALAEWIPKLIFLGIALLVAWTVIRFWINYFDSIGKAIQF